MHVLCLVKEELDQSGREILAAIGQEHDVETIDLAGEPDYETVLTRIESCDRVICW